MKKLFPFILTGTILASSCMICYGGTATLSKENKETSFDIYATYEPGENDYFSAPVRRTAHAKSNCRTASASQCRTSRRKI